MAVNYFKRGRKATKLVALLWFIGWVVIAIAKPIWDVPEAFAIASWGLLFIFGFSWALGWLLRHFLGIRTGLDQREPGRSVDIGDIPDTTADSIKSLRI